MGAPRQIFVAIFHSRYFRRPETRGFSVKFCTYPQGWSTAAIHLDVEWPPSDRTLKALLRFDGGVHPAVLHHAVRRTEAEIVHMIGNISPAMYYARRNDQHVTDLQLDFA